MSKYSKILMSLLIVFLVLACVSLVFGAPKEKEKKRSDSYADKVDRRIDKLSMVVAQKAEEGVDVTKAEGLLLEAIDLYEKGKIDEAMNKMDDVERAIGLEPMRQERFGPGREQGPPPEFGMGDRSQKPRELSNEEKQELKAVIKKLVKEAQGLIEKDDYEGAFDILTEAHKKLCELTGHFKPMPMMQPPMEGQGPPWGGGFGGPGAGQFSGPNQGPGGPFPPPQGEEGFRGQGRGEGFGFGPGMRSRMPEMDPEKHFQKLRDMGEDGYEKAIKFFEKAIGFLKEREITIKEDAIKKYEEAKKLHEKGNLDAAFDSLHDAFMILRDSMPRPENHPRLGREDDKRGKEQGRKSKFDKGRSGKELSREDREKIEAAFKSLKGAYDKYIDKFGEDEFTNEQFENFKKLERSVKRGEISVADAIEKLKSMEKEVQKKLGEKK